MHCVDDPERTALEMRDAAKAADMSVFPDVPMAEDLEPKRSVLQAEWPDEDWRAFIEAGRELGLRLLYVLVCPMSQMDLDNWDLQYPLIQDPVWQEVRECLDEPALVIVVWMHEGVVHFWMAQASWHKELGERLRRENDAAEMTLSR